ncbi:uncharacterized protein LOC114301407 [Camellia sinensis]|uniref:uncharacterized protein LOC114301407 n=1 Tax=Camellia sinensis TaxID=4442 RepID=UPI0010367A5B|nr:uncharacterized protein LOC114301407 [Camellia sinensis]
MASLSSSIGLQYHVRSISLPSRLHPHSNKIEAQLNKLKTWETSFDSKVPSSAETALLQRQHGMLVEEALEGSIGLLDLCSKTRDFLLVMKEKVLGLQLVLRSKGGDCIESDMSAYTLCKKRVKKEAAKCLGALKQMEKKFGSSTDLLDVNHYLSVVIRVLGEVTSATISVLRSLLLFMLLTTSTTKPSGWSLISKLILTRSSTSERGSDKIFNEVESVDVALHSLHRCIPSNDAKIDVEMARKRLQKLDGSIEGLEARLDCLFRRLIQNRVSLLNILAH